MGKAVFILLMMMPFFGITSQLEKVEPDKVGDIELSRDEVFQISWELSNPSGEVKEYSVHWDDGEMKRIQLVDFPQTSGQLDDLECLCGQKINITVTPINKHGDHIGSSNSLLFICQDIVTIDNMKLEEEMIHVFWSVRCPSDQFTGFMVMWHSDLYGYEMVCLYSEDARNTSSSSEGCHGRQHRLHQCTAYAVSVQPQSDTVGYTAVLAEKHSRTLEGPSLSLLDLEYVELESESATLSWRKPECPVTGYIIFYSGQAKWGEHQRDVGKSRVEEAVSEKENESRAVRAELLHFGGSNTEAAVIYHLMPYSLYEFCVADTIAKNDTRNCIVVETKEANPEPPALLYTGVINDNNLNLTWNAPVNVRGKLHGYTVTWSMGVDIIGSEKVHLETYTITGLESCATYHVSVTASTGAGDGEPVQKEVKLNHGCDVLSTVLAGSITAVAVVLCCIIVFAKRRAIKQTWTRIRPSSATDSTHLPVRFSKLEIEAHIENDRMVNSSDGELVSRSWRDEHEEPFPFQKRKMNSDKTTVFFISAGLGKKEVYDFLLFIWKKNVKTIIMLNCSDHYWPENETGKLIWRNLTVRSKDEVCLSKNYKIRSVTLKKDAQCKSFKEYRIQDNINLTMPASTYVLTELIDDVLNAMIPGQNNILISSNNVMVEEFLTLFDEKLSKTRHRNSAVETYYSELESKLKHRLEVLNTPQKWDAELKQLNERSFVGENSAGKMPENEKKNRNDRHVYLPFDSNRVQLRNAPDNITGYINASYVTASVMEDVGFIACQSPMPNTVSDFWWMVWEQNIRIIVMLIRSDAVEQARGHKYWVGEHEQTFSTLVVKKSSIKEVLDDMIIRKMVLTNGHETRSVIHFQFISWSEQSVPNSDSNFLMLLKKVREHIQPDMKNIIVHCRGGVGRTGTFIALWQLQVQAERRVPGVDVGETVLELRRHREMLVEYKEQYKFLHNCFLKYLQEMSIWKPTIKSRHTSEPNALLTDVPLTDGTEEHSVLGGAGQRNIPL